LCGHGSEGFVELETRGDAPPKRRRLSQAERSAGTQARLIEATIACLHRVGYSQTTVSMVAEAAGVSRGALTHQYATKVDLMLAVIQAAAEADVASWGELLDARPAAEVVGAIPQAMWRALNQPAMIAVIEIMMATRSDPVLMERLRAIQVDNDAVAKRLLLERLRAAGVAPAADSEVIYRLFVAVLRGVAIERMSLGERARAEEVIFLLGTILAQLLPRAAS
jgi:AcrR family transcriptional regulator